VGRFRSCAVFSTKRPHLRTCQPGTWAGGNLLRAGDGNSPALPLARPQALRLDGSGRCLKNPPAMRVCVPREVPMKQLIQTIAGRFGYFIIKKATLDKLTNELDALKTAQNGHQAPPLSP
jgi:hypothetical protein